MKPILFVLWTLVSLASGVTANAETSVDNRSPLVAQANALAAKGDYIQAEEIYSRLIHDNPDCGVFWSNRGVIRTFQKQYKTAEADFLTALHITADDSFTMTGLGRLYTRIGKYDHAEWYLTQALRYDPKDTVALAELNLLHEIQNK